MTGYIFFVFSIKKQYLEPHLLNGILRAITASGISLKLSSTMHELGCACCTEDEDSRGDTESRFLQCGCRSTIFISSATACSCAKERRPSPHVLYEEVEELEGVNSLRLPGILER